MLIPLGLWTLLVAAVISASISIDKPTLPDRADVYPGEPPGPRTSFVVTSKFCVILLSGLLGTQASSTCNVQLTRTGYRIRILDRQPFNRITLTQVYVFILYFLSIGFAFSAAVVNNGLGLGTNGVCKVAMRLCIVFYAGSKVSM